MVELDDIYQSILGVGKIFLRIREKPNSRGELTYIKTDTPKKKTHIQRPCVDTGATAYCSAGPFDGIFYSETTTSQIFSEHIENLIRGISRGNNLVIAAYGQSGSGKTFTLLGEPDTGDHPDKIGILGNSINFINHQDEFIEGVVGINMFQFYLDKNQNPNYGIILDMVFPHTAETRDNFNVKTFQDKQSFKYGDALQKRLNIGVVFRNLGIIKKDNLSPEVEKLLSETMTGPTYTYSNMFKTTDIKGHHILDFIKTRRFQRAMPMNPDSSRSHAFVTLNLAVRVDGKLELARLVFSDLGGSEKVSDFILGNSAAAQEGTLIQNTLNDFKEKIVPDIMTGKKSHYNSNKKVT